MNLIAFTLITRLIVMMLGGVIFNLCLNKNYWGIGIIFGAIWIQSIHKFILFSARHHIGGFNSQGGEVYDFLQQDIITGSLELILIISIMVFLYRIENKKF